MRGISSPVGTTTEIIGDINWLKETFSNSVSDCDVSIVGRAPNWKIKSVKSSNTSILSNPDPINPLKLFYQSNGTVSVEVELTSGEKCADSFTTYTESLSPTVYTFNNYLSGSLASHIYSQISSIANGSTSSPSHYQLYSTFNQSSNTFVKNSGFWASSLDFSGVSVNKVGSGGVTGVVMVTPRHAIGAAHYAPPYDPNGGPIVGDKIYFCDPLNNTIERTVVSVVNSATSDSRIIKFDSDVPQSIKKYKLLPSNWKNYFPVDAVVSINPRYNLYTYRAAQFVPIIAMSHYRWDNDWTLQRSNRYAYIYQSGIQWTVMSPNPETRALGGGGYVGSSYFGGQFNDYSGSPSGIRGGDSGLPCFYTINGELIFAYKHLNGDPSTGSIINSWLLSEDLTNIQNAINSLGSEGHSLQTVNLSGFTDFSS
jgi:hypothetical protein